MKSTRDSDESLDTRLHELLANNEQAQAIIIGPEEDG
jgi:hypothetical protein